MAITIQQGDCFALLPLLPTASIDAVITDPPYGSTALPWDHKIDLAAWWSEIMRVVKPSGIVAVFTQQPFTTDVINSNRSQFRYEIIWHKTCPMGFLNAKSRPLKAHENILIFSQTFKRSNDGKRAASTYNPQFTVGKPYTRKHQAADQAGAHYGRTKGVAFETINEGTRCPTDVIEVSNRNGKSLHPTQKPLDLLKWLVLTYTNPGELVLDPFAGSGTTLVACQETGRQAIGMEKEENYVKIIEGRLK